METNHHQAAAAKPGIDVLAIGSHPDDVEIGAAATLAREAGSGRSVLICDLTAGEMGTNGDVATRAAEGRAAAAIIGAQGRICLGLPDTALWSAADGAGGLAAVIRAYRPRLVLGPWGQGDRHPDHQAGQELVRRAVFLAGLTRYVPPCPEGLSLPAAIRDLAPYRVNRLLYYLINSPAQPELLVDVSNWYNYKRRALAAFDSQFGARASASPTALNDGIYLPGVEGRDASFGRTCGVGFAEGYRVDRPPLLASPLDILHSR